MKLEELKSKEILILGLGTEGFSTLKHLRKLFPDKTIGVADEKELNEFDNTSQRIITKDKKLKRYLGKNYHRSLNLYEVIFRTPGMPLPKNTTAKITSQTKIFVETYRDKIIGVTGTKGKTTTSSLIHKILKDAGMKVHLVGNIGNPPFDYLDEVPKTDFFVYELSSFQLQDLNVSPHVAVFLNLYEEHLDYHGGFENYKRAKKNIVKWQNKNDYIIYNSDSKIVEKIVKKYKAKKVPFSLKQKKAEYETKLKGKFNLNNILAAVAAAKILKIPYQSITSSVKAFEPVKHRLEFIGNFRGIDFYNDSIATIPEATIAAIETLKPNVATLIVGGFDRGINYKGLSKKIVEEKIPNIILFPQTGKIILEGIKDLNRYQPKHFSVKTMKEAVKIAAEVTEKGKICLLSPASSSFNLFKNIFFLNI